MNPAQKEAMQYAVNKGVMWLDETIPDWRKRINVRTLYMESCRSCVIGQLFGDYFVFEKIHSSAFMLEHGFTDVNMNWFELDNAWKKVLNKS